LKDKELGVVLTKRINSKDWEILTPQLFIDELQNVVRRDPKTTQSDPTVTPQGDPTVTPRVETYQTTELPQAIIDAEVVDDLSNAGSLTIYDVTTVKLAPTKKRNYEMTITVKTTDLSELKTETNNSLQFMDGLYDVLEQNIIQNAVRVGQEIAAKEREVLTGTLAEERKKTVVDLLNVT
jgi:hypothetical protein